MGLMIIKYFTWKIYHSPIRKLLVIGGVNRKSYIQMMEQEAQNAQKTGRIRVIVQDNGLIHRCHEVQKL